MGGYKSIVAARRIHLIGERSGRTGGHCVLPFDVLGERRSRTSDLSDHGRAHQGEHEVLVVVIAVRRWKSAHRQVVAARRC